MSEDPPKAREIVVPEPEPGSRTRIAIAAAGIVWILLHVLIPLRYYRDGADLYDERFAWRMFSSVRVRQCEVAVTEIQNGAPRPLALMEVLPAPWAELLKRNRPAVIERFLAWRCEREGTSEVRFENRCVDATGEPLPPIELTMDCSDRSIERGGER